MHFSELSPVIERCMIVREMCFSLLWRLKFKVTLPQVQCLVNILVSFSRMVLGCSQVRSQIEAQRGLSYFLQALLLGT